MNSFKYVILVAVLVLSACGGASSGDGGVVLDALDKMAAEAEAESVTGDNGEPGSESLTGDSGQSGSESVTGESGQAEVTDRGARAGQPDIEADTEPETETDGEIEPEAETSVDTEAETEPEAETDGEVEVEVEADDEGGVETATAVPTVVVLTGDETPEICPSVELVAAAAGLALDLVTSFIEETDSFGTDPESGVTSCNYQGADSSFIALSFRESPVDTTWILDGSIEGIQPTELDAGAIQVQFEGQPDSCEIYDGQTSVVVFTGSASVDVCGAALAVVALG